MTRLLGLLIVVGIVMYLVAGSMQRGEEAYAVPCMEIRTAVLQGNTDNLHKLILAHTRDRGMSRIALTARAQECSEGGWLTAQQTEQFMTMVMPQ